jgi:hypothetical protein
MCCGWLSAQPRSGSGVQCANFSEEFFPTAWPVKNLIFLQSMFDVSQSAKNIPIFIHLCFKTSHPARLFY